MTAMTIMTNMNIVNTMTSMTTMVMPTDHVTVAYLAVQEAGQGQAESLHILGPQVRLGLEMILV